MDNEEKYSINQGTTQPLFGGSSAPQSKPLFDDQEQNVKPLFGNETPAPAPVSEAAQINESAAFVPETAPVPEAAQSQVDVFGMPSLPPENTVPQSKPMPEIPQPEPVRSAAVRHGKIAFTIPIDSSSIGQLMRNARDIAGLSLEEVFNTTRISEKFVQAIENDDFNSLPLGSFPRAYIRKLVSFYNIEESAIQLINEKLKKLPQKENVTQGVLDDVGKTVRHNEEEDKRVRKIFYTVVSSLAALLLILGIGIACLVVSHVKKKDLPVETVNLEFSISDLEKLSAPQIPVMTELKIPSAQ